MADVCSDVSVVGEVGRGGERHILTVIFGEKLHSQKFQVN